MVRQEHLFSRGVRKVVVDFIGGHIHQNGALVGISLPSCHVLLSHYADQYVSLVVICIFTYCEQKSWLYPCIHYIRHTTVLQLVLIRALKYILLLIVCLRAA